MECYDPRKDQWQLLNPINNRSSSVVTAAVGNKLYSVGVDNGTDYHRFTMVYCPSTKMWRTGCPLYQPRTGAAVAVLDGFIYGEILLLS
ncbi:kelch repeat protein [Ancylostoma duodenale]|uniref:Kelch repeat protein n=1 Tax=Ancylostoma duodenale TaxID=51022 RepID=A0A0C2CPT6_9BILA|nr:kelch repeat protein [Ancylostoma duodenale]